MTIQKVYRQFKSSPAHGRMFFLGPRRRVIGSAAIRVVARSGTLEFPLKGMQQSAALGSIPGAGSLKRHGPVGSTQSVKQSATKRATAGRAARIQRGLEPMPSNEVVGRLLDFLVEENGGTGYIERNGMRWKILVQEDETTPDDTLDAETAAIERQLLAKGQAGKRMILSQPDMLDLQAAADLSGASIRTLTNWRQRGQILALSAPGAQKGFRFPAWQFGEPVRAAMPTIVQAFGLGRAWQAYDFLTRSEPLLGGAIPLVLLQAGQGTQVERVLKVAAGLEHGGH
jgi:hypothetical protein